MEPSAATLARIEFAVVDWLLRAAQIREGSNQGGVLGWFDHQPSSRFVYGEITGYYLSYLGFLHSAGVQPARLRPGCAAALNWIQRQWLEYPATRIYLDGCQSRDWRNSYSFSFDEVMILRGIYASSMLADTGLRDLLLKELCRRLTSFIGQDGLLLPCLPRGDASLPGTWSTRKGPYQLKAAAALLAMSSTLPAHLQSCSQKTVEAWSTFIPQTIMIDELHPLLYFVEGLVIAGAATKEQSYLAHARQILKRVLQFLFESTPLELLRSDVIAQTLRLTRLTGARDCVTETDLFAALVRFIAEDGSVYFRRNANGELEHANTWSGMFAAQALHHMRTLEGTSASFDEMKQVI